MKPQTNPTPALLAGLSVFLCWGFFADYFQLIIDRGVPADVLLAHRIVWCSAFCVGLIFITRRVTQARELFQDKRRLLRLTISSILVAINWMSFIYAIQTHVRTDAALGYFINPLLTVALGVVLLGEKLGPIKWLCVALAFGGVTMIVIANGGRVPWLALTVAFSFAFYGLVRKRISVEPVLGLSVETLLLLPLALAYLAWNASTTPLHVTPSTYALLMLAGVITAIPLILFGYAAPRLPLGTMGFLQYVTPTCQLLMAVLMRGEPIRHRIGGFVLIWIALGVFGLTAVPWRRSADLVGAAEEADAAAEAGI